MNFIVESRRIAGLGIALLVSVSSDVTIANPVVGTTQIVARSGESPLNSDWNPYQFGPVHLNDAGHTAFLTLDGVGRHAILSGEENGVHLVVRDGQPLPGSDANNFPADTFNITWFDLNNRGNLAFSVVGYRLGEPRPHTGVFIAHDADGAQLSEVSLEPADGGAGPESLLAHHLTDDDRGPLIVTGSVQSTGVLYRTDGAGLHEIARSDQLSPAGIELKQFGDIEANALGNVAFVLGTSNRGFGLYRADPTGQTTIVADGQLTPNADGRIVNSTDGRQETRLNPIAFNELNEVAFLAQIAGTDGRTEAQSGIFSGNGHELREIARTGQNAPDRGVFIDLDPPQINNRGEVLFGAQADPVTGANWPNGLFLATEDGVQAIVRAGDPLPSGESFFTEFRWPQLTDWGVVFLGRRSSDSADAVSYGLYAWNGTSIIEIASARQQLDGSTVVGLSAITRSGGYGVNERGQVAYSVTLPGQRTVLAIWSIPIPEPTAALLAGQLLALTAMRRIRDRHRR